MTTGLDTVTFQATAVNDTVLTVFYQHPFSSASGAVYGAGVTCLPGATMMLYWGQAGHGEPLGQITRPRPVVDPAVHVRSAALGDVITAGATRFYMAAYRDKKAALVQNCAVPTALFNATQAYSITWGP